MAENEERYVCPYAQRCTRKASGLFDESPIFREGEVYVCRHVVEGKLKGCWFTEQLNLLERLVENTESIKSQGMGAPS
jgi:hypothetical protein